MGGRHVDPGPRQPQGRLDDTSPGQRPRAPPELVEAGRDAGHRAGGDPDVVVDELRPEGNAELDELRLPRRPSEPRHGDEEVEQSTRPDSPSSQSAWPPPAIPVITVSATQDASEAATAASTAVPPSARISRPASAVAG